MANITIWRLIPPHTMQKNILEDLGLSPNEAKMYESLLELGESTISSIAIHSKVHRRNAYDAINRLIEKGLCFEILSKSENHYSPVDPEKLLEIVSEKQNRLLGALPDLRAKFENQRTSEEAYIYRGYEGLKNIWRTMVRIGLPVYTIGARGQWFDERLTMHRSSFFKEANRKKLHFYNLFDHTVKSAMPNLYRDFPAKLDYHFLPKEYATNSTINIFGDYVVTYTYVVLGKMDEHVTFFVIHNKDLANSYRTWFQYMWDQSSQ